MQMPLPVLHDNHFPRCASPAPAGSETRKCLVEPPRLCPFFLFLGMVEEANANQKLREAQMPPENPLCRPSSPL